MALDDNAAIHNCDTIHWCPVGSCTYASITLDQDRMSERHLAGHAPRWVLVPAATGLLVAVVFTLASGGLTVGIR